MNINKALDKAYEGKSFKELVAAPVSAIEGISENDAKLLEQAFGVNPDISYLPRAGGNSKPTQNIRNTGGQFLGIDGRN